MWPFPKHKSRPAVVVLGAFDPGEAGVYRYLAGYDSPPSRGPSKPRAKQWAEADPMDLVRRLSERAGDLGAAFQMANSAVVAKVGNAGMKAAQEEAYFEFVDHLRYIFDVRPFKDGGLSEVQLLMLFNDFTAWKDALKKNSSQSPTTPEETSSTTPPPTPPSTAAGPPTSTSSASGSTADAPCTETPTPTTSAPSSPPESPTPAPPSGRP